MRKLLVLILILSACSGNGSEGPLLTFADLDSPPTTVDVNPGSSTSTTALSVPATTTTSTTLLVVDVPAPITILGSDHWSVLEGRGVPVPIVDERVGLAFDDLLGGFLFQFSGAGEDVTADQRVFWSRPSSPDAQPFLDVLEDDSALRLWGVEQIDGRPQAIFTVIHNFSDPDTRREDLVLYDFETGDRVLATVGGWESGPLVIDYGGGRFVIERGDEGLTSFEFRDSAGQVIDLASNPHPGCFDDATCPTNPALDPSGGLLVYLQRSPLGDGDLLEVELVVRDIDLGEEISRIPLPIDPSGEMVLDFDGSVALVNQLTPEGYRAIVVDVGAGTLGDFGLEGLVRFLRLELDIDGPVEVLRR